MTTRAHLLASLARRRRVQQAELALARGSAHTRLATRLTGLREQDLSPTARKHALMRL
jgi:hypothetical protein